MPPINGSHSYKDEDDAGQIGVSHPHSRSRAPGHPLRRGDACLMCRAKKLKCSAQKPVCDQCSKRNDRCVYDAVRPASRVERLERKLAEMDEQDFREALARRASAGFSRFGFDQTNSVIDSSSANSLGQDNGIPNLGYNLLGSHPSSQLPLINGDTTSPNSVDQLLNTDSESLVDINDMPLTAWSWPSTSTTATFDAALLNHSLMSDGALPQLAPSPMSWTAIGTQSNLTGFTSYTNTSSPPFNGFHRMSVPSTASASDPTSRAQSHDSTTSPTPPQIALNSSPPIPGLDNLSINLSSVHKALDTYQHYALSQPQIRCTNTAELGKGLSHTSNGHFMTISGEFTWKSVLPQAESTAIEASDMVHSVYTIKKEIDDQERAMKTKELSTSARDYLLDLFFSTMPPRPECGSELFSQEEFKARLALPESQQPHPCLLFSMYTTAASGSYVPAIRKLAEPLFKIAVMKLEAAIRKQDRLLDAIKASKNLSKWLFTKARILEGYQFSTKAISLCIACGLHQIPSSVYGPQAVKSTESQSGSSIGPPRDQADLADRIHTFWSAWGIERGGNLTHSWHSAIKDQDVTTPLPRNKADYLTDALLNEPDITLKDLYDLPHRSDSPAPKSLYTYLLIAVHLIHRSMTLSQQPAESVAASFRSQSVFAKSLDHKIIPSVHHPIACKEIATTAEWLEANMPEEWGTSFMDNAKWQEPEVFVVALCLKVARMHLHPLDSRNEHQTGLSIAFEASKLIKSLIKYYLKDRTSVHSLSFSPMNHIPFANQHSFTAPDFDSSDENTRVNTPMPNSVFSLPNNSFPIPTNNDFSQTWGYKGFSRDFNGISGPYTLSPSYWVVEKLAGGARLMESIGRPQDAHTCMTEAHSIINGFRELAVTHDIVGEHVEKLEKLTRSRCC
ncbi:uncharacterized protein I206_103922 [Kwoniella pini CBS 10737]|uniref:Zn(2)-C6 fungal-type domain-containing protein n=1 Tax=Kwoniella pini CBS 10737 TaxID=1296096 RepID=A0AAJ8L5V7_9TREE